MREKLLDPTGTTERAVDTTLAPGCGARTAWPRACSRTASRTRVLRDSFRSEAVDNEGEDPGAGTTHA